MQIILLSGGSGARLWPLSNSVRSKQFLRLFDSPDGEKESMLQRVVRQIKGCLSDADITVATSSTQKDAIIAQLGNQIEIISEPSRRDTFPAIALATSYLRSVRNISDNEVVVVMPCDPFTDSGYFETIRKMCEEVASGCSNLVLMGIKPDSPSSKFGYMIPVENGNKIDRFVEKPSPQFAEKLIAQGALWNGGVFAFRLGYLTSITEKYFPGGDFHDIYKGYDQLPKKSFDYEVVEKESKISFVPFTGKWEDLGTWDSLSGELNEESIGNAVVSDSKHTTVINELDIPVVCKGVNNLIVALSPDGVLVAEKSLSGQIKNDVEGLIKNPMYEEKSWGSYSTLDNLTTEKQSIITTKRCHINNNCIVSEECDSYNRRILTFLCGKGNIEIGNIISPIAEGMVVEIPENSSYTIHSNNSIELIETEIKRQAE